MATDSKKTGIGALTRLPWGTHLCHFYETTADLLDTVVPYFKAGLESGEYCLWVIAQPLTEEDAATALRQVVPDIDGYVAGGAIEILTYDRWYFRGGALRLRRVLDEWLEKLDRALTRGYAGMRAAAHTAWLDRKDWKDFLQYEQVVGEAIADRRMTILCGYPLAEAGAAEILDVARAHERALAKRRGKWEVLETPELKQAKRELKQLKDELEKRVVERTQQLTEVNDALAGEVVERMRAEEALRESQKRFRIFSELTSDCACQFRVEPDGSVVLDWTTDAFARMYGYTVADVNALGWSSIAHPDDRALVTRYFERAAAGHSDVFEHRLMDKSGTVSWLRCYLRPVADVHGRIVHIYAAGRNVTARREAEAARADYARQLHDLSRQLVEAQEEERARISRGLHDDVGQALTALKLNLEAVQLASRGGIPSLAESVALADSVLQQVRELSLDLRPSLLDDLGLPAALRWYLDRQGQRAGWTIHFTAEPFDTRLRSEIETVCFRVSQEAITNIVRHARATRVWVNLRESCGELQLSIRDDGVGFDVDDARALAIGGRSLGLLSMHERIAPMGGRLEIRSVPAGGTEVQVRLPLGSAEASGNGQNAS
jgi:PAS domain S-box-containing protein